MNVFQFIELIKMRPKNVVVTQAITELEACLEGFLLARKLNNIHEKKELEVFNVFSDWVAERLGFERKYKEYSWAAILRFFYRDERSAFDNFFMLWDEFIADNYKDIDLTVEIKHRKFED